MPMKTKTKDKQQPFQMGGQGSGLLAGEEASSPGGLSPKPAEPTLPLWPLLPTEFSSAFRTLNPLGGFFGGSLANYYRKGTKEEKGKHKIISTAQKNFYPLTLARQRIFRLHSAVKSVLMPPTFRTPPPLLPQPFHSPSSSSPRPPPLPAPAISLASNPNIHLKQTWGPNKYTLPLTHIHMCVYIHTATPIPHWNCLTSDGDVSHDTPCPTPSPSETDRAQLLFRGSHRWWLFHLVTPLEP